MHRPHVLTAALLALALVPHGVAAATSGTPVVVGAVLATSGAFAPLGEPVKNAMMMAQDDVNAHGGIHGHPMQIEFVDDGGKPDTAAQLATSFSGRNIPIVIGSTVSPPTTGIARVAETSNLVQIYMTPTAQIWDTPHGVAKHVFEVTPRNEFEAKTMLTFLSTKLHVKKIAVVNDENVYGSTGLKIVQAEAPKHDITVIDNEAYGTNATDATAQLQHVKAANPDAIIIWGASPTTALVVSQARGMGITVPIIGASGMLNDNFLRIAGKAGDGLYSMSQLNITHPNAAESAFIEMYHKRFGSRPPTYAGNGWNAVHVAALALAANPGKSADDIAAWLERMPTYHGTMPVGFTAADHAGGSAVYIAQAHNGVWFTL